jgi:hypothetical protein
MKIAILTHFHNSTNYGGVLQAYALCKYLNNSGHKACQILYSQNNTRLRESSLTLKEISAKIISRVEKKIYHSKNKTIKKNLEDNFAEFRNSVPHTQTVYSKATISQTQNEFDAFITGSDQVWNPIWYDSAYFLDFAGSDRIKISYAASIGIGSLDDLQSEMFKKNLSGFNQISVREKMAEELLSPLTKKPISVSVDPTLLLSSDDWDEIATERRIDEPYVFLYALGNDMKIRKIAEEFSKHKGLKLVMLSDLMGYYRREDRKIKADIQNDITPNDFISLIKYADCVITDSFHACVFSLLYKREFFAFSRTGGLKMGSRIQNLTKTFDCCEHYCTEKKQLSVEYLLSVTKIDYSKSFDTFVTEQKESMEYLNIALK